MSHSLLSSLRDAVGEDAEAPFAGGFGEGEHRAQLSVVDRLPAHRLGVVVLRVGEVLAVDGEDHHRLLHHSVSRVKLASIFPVPVHEPAAAFRTEAGHQSGAVGMPERRPSASGSYTRNAPSEDRRSLTYTECPPLKPGLPSNLAGTIE